MARRMQYAAPCGSGHSVNHIKPWCSGDLLPPSPPAEKATTRQDQAGQASTGDGAGNGVGGYERDVAGGVGAADYAVSADSEPRGHPIEATAGVGPSNLVKGRVGGSEQMARQRNGGSEDAVCRIEEGIQSNLRETTTRTLALLTPREERIIRMRFGIGINKDHTLEEVGQRFSVTRERIRQIEAKALRKLKHPSRSRILRSFLHD